MWTPTSWRAWALSDPGVAHSPASVAARCRGAAAGSLTAALAMVAHSWASGAAPSGAGVVLLGVLAVTLGAIAATSRAAAGAGGLLTILAVGQVLGHVLLGASGHDHVAAAPSGSAMFGAHVAAVVCCALVIAAAGRLAEALSRAVRVPETTATPPVPTSVDTVVRSADQPLQATLALAASLSHRGPPVAVN